MEKTKYQFKCNTNVAQNIINQFLQANDYKEQSNPTGLTYYKFSDAICKGFLEYEFKDGFVIISAYIRSEKKPMPLDNSFVGSIPKSHYKNVIAPLLKALSDASSQSENSQNVNNSVVITQNIEAENSNSQTINSQITDSTTTNVQVIESSDVNQTTQGSSNTTQSTSNTYNQFVEQNQSSKEKFAIAAFIISLIGLVLSFLGLIYGWIIIFLEYYFAIQGLKTRLKGLSIAAIVLASVSIFINIIVIILSIALL